MKPVYIALIVIGCLLLAAGIGVGIYFGIQASHPSPKPTTSTSACTDGKTLCGKVCCSSSINLGSGCVCLESCSTQNVGTFNGSVFCCGDKDYASVVDDQCCTTPTSGVCKAGTPLT